jgi:hypothetical protein
MEFLDQLRKYQLLKEDSAAQLKFKSYAHNMKRDVQLKLSLC